METKTEPKSKEIANFVQTLEIYQCEIMKFTETMKEFQRTNNPHKRMITNDLIISLMSATAQISELVSELKEKP